MRICQLASGSKGNSIYIESETTRILIDAGLSALQLGNRLADINVDVAELDAVFITHEHSDHCRGIGPLSRRYGVEVYIHPSTYAMLPKLGEIRQSYFDIGETIACKDIEVTSFPITHDAAAPVGFTVDTSAGKIGIATDLGVATRLVEQRLSSCRALIVETNHDELMLRDGPYPWELKQRIRSNHGHLSNSAGAQLLQRLLWGGLDSVFLAHLSETNNTPVLAQQQVDAMLQQQDVCQPQLIIGAPQQVSCCFDSSI
ncbi:MAG: MBL fold metallo-hydrolase [Desulfobacteraceae bacterium 4572_35.1]|nr:MAG: MBL fold metallo-hydrolase [Desulfobacteraceae bacterium 4572_35.1]